MIVYPLTEFAKNPNLSPKMRKAIDFLLKPETAQLQDGTYQIDGSRIYAQVQTYRTSLPDKILFEAHRKYIDIQYILEGNEIISCLNLEDINIVRPYDPKYDICFGLPRMTDGIQLKLAAGDMVVFFPEHAHAPKLTMSGPARVRKIVVKVSVS